MLLRQPPLLFAALTFSSLVHAEDLQLAPVEVTSSEASAGEIAQAQLKSVPGGTNFIDMSSVAQGRVSTNEDVFKYQAGVYAKAANNEGIKLSIRGSGLNRSPGAHGSGLYEMFDGLPLTGPGGTPYELKVPLWQNHVEVLRGANGFDQGALALGGAVNYVTHTGYDAPKLQLRYEVGSKGYAQREISSGQVLGDADYYISLTDSESDGYQRQSAATGKGFAANFGYRFSPELETRFYIRYRETTNDTPGKLTRDQISHDPRAANSLNAARDSKRLEPGSTWIANKTTLQLDDSSRLEFGLAYHDYPMDLREGTIRLKVAYTDISSTLNYIRQDTLFGHDSKTTVGLRTTQAMPNNGGSEYVRIPGAYAPGTKTRDYSYLGSDTVLHIGNDLELVPDLWLTTGLAAIYTRRETEVSYPETDAKVSQHAWDYAPRIGLRCDFTPQLQVYGNLSRSVEPPHAWSMIWGSGNKFTTGPAAGYAREGIKLKNQTATTLEIGGRGEQWFGQWDLALYRSEVRHELLTVETQAQTATTNAVTAENNASPTVHQGVELSLLSPLWEGGRNGRLALRQAYTYSDFHYRDDDRFGGNTLPGIPKHYYQAQVRYSHPTGFYTSLNTEHSSKVAVDYANSFYAASYTLLGATFGYDAPKQDWQAWVDLRNLTNKRYANTVTPGYDDKGLDAARSTPGDGRGIYTGVSWAWR
ncbi:TonB-dependent receptor [Pseudomonas kairouanensis]|uniref:TonB-dependent receptor n=1 Tax=Pseudomonas kairouanensis TaxID=2293832 RepID=A0A4Z0AL21_9PSED|nr:TonB-dependent receptor [Pseudomonas kairouanensis]TFY86678.1 TonB-dependent receptor [Pseudomonas kairouanensis]